MAITIDWATKVISVPKSFLEYDAGPPETWELIVDNFRLALKALEASETGIVFDDTHRHNAQVTVAGVILAMVVEIINGYTVTFENGSYIASIIGANTNIQDVTNLNSVSVRSANSAGLTDPEDVPEVLLDQEYVELGLTVRNAMRVLTAFAAGKLSGADPGSTTVRLKNVGTGAKNRVTATVDEFGNRSAVTLDLTDE